MCLETFWKVSEWYNNFYLRNQTFEKGNFIGDVYVAVALRGLKWNHFQTILLLYLYPLKMAKKQWITNRSLKFIYNRKFVLQTCVWAWKRYVTSDYITADVTVGYLISCCRSSSQHAPSIFRRSSRPTPVRWVLASSYMRAHSGLCVHLSSIVTGVVGWRLTEWRPHCCNLYPLPAVQYFFDKIAARIVRLALCVPAGFLPVVSAVRMRRRARRSTRIWKRGGIGNLRRDMSD